MMHAGKDYGVRVIRAWGNFSVGRILFPWPNDRADFLRKKMVEVVKPPPDLLENVTGESDLAGSRRKARK